MKPNDSNTTSTSEIKHRVIVAVQTRGGGGKSTSAIGLCEWFRQRKASWQGYDLDGFNRTLSTVYPDEITAVEMDGNRRATLLRFCGR